MAVPDQQKTKKNRQQNKTGFLQRLRCRKVVDKSEKASLPQEAPTDSQSDYDDTRLGTRNDDPTSDKQNDTTPSDNHQTSRSAGKDSINATQNPVRTTAPPTARDSAFSGPPRYDWIDIETAAAVKIQSVARRYIVVSDMESRGETTAAMRNRNRRRRAKKGSANAVTTEDTPSLFGFCGMGLIFGDATEEDDKAQREWEKAQYEEKKHQRALEEERLRAYKPRTKENLNMIEAVEVTE